MTELREIALAVLLGLSLGGCGATQGTIGAVLAQREDGRLFVREVPHGLGAEKAGLAPGDEILLVDGVDVRMLDEKHVYETLSGEVGSKVRLTIVRGEEVLHVTVERTPARRYRLGTGAH